nr:type II toxin-antitoxin system RelE/ParE family toxin [uncultured Noviherbaspirillum sp.]
MSLQVTFHRDAQEEFLGAISWYQNKRSGLALEFMAEVERCKAMAAESPSRYASVEGGIRRIGLNRFPYIVYFRPEKNHIVVLGVFHTKRDPAIWPRRP